MAIFCKKHCEKDLFGLFHNKKMQVCLCIGMILMSCSASVQMFEKENVLAQETLRMYAGSYALMDGDTGRVLVEKQAEEPMANASTTKILTCIVALEHCALDEVVSISANASAQPRVRYGIKEGEQYVLKELLYGLMLESYNDCAVAIAEHVAGSETGFAELLNAKAAEIGCKDTYFITPNGLDAENEGGFHHTTAQDLCKIMAYCVWESPMKESFLEITQTKSYGPFVNHNAFLGQMDGVLSGKTGFTSKAGYCYVAALEQDGERYTIALLACGWPNNKNYKWHDARELFTYGLETYDKKEVVFDEKKEVITMEGFVNAPVFSMLNISSEVQLVAEKRQYECLMAVKERLRIEKVMEEHCTMPVEKGEVFGTYHIYLGDVKIDEIPLISQDSAKEWDIVAVCKVIIRQFLSVAS